MLLLRKHIDSECEFKTSFSLNDDI